MCGIIFVLDKLMFYSPWRSVVSFGGNHQKGAIILSWIERKWRTPRLPAVRVTHFEFLRENLRLFGTFFFFLTG